MYERGLFVEPLFGGTDDIGDPRDLFDVPSRILERLVELSSGAIRSMADEWSLRCCTPPSDPVDFLSTFCALAQHALSVGGKLYCWNIHPLHRERTQ
jgi:hypothetical protein